jgi:hypothetical protein
MSVVREAKTTQLVSALRALLLAVAGLALFAAGGARADRAGPAEGFDIHVMAPHVVEGVVMGPLPRQSRDRHGGFRS